MTAKELMEDILEACFDQYEELTDEQIENMTEEQAKAFVIDHIADMIAINGSEQYLWYVELNAIKELNLYDTFDIPKEYVEQRLEAYA